MLVSSTKNWYINLWINRSCLLIYILFHFDKSSSINIIWEYVNCLQLHVYLTKQRNNTLKYILSPKLTTKYLDTLQWILDYFYMYYFLCFHTEPYCIMWNFITFDANNTNRKYTEQTYFWFFFLNRNAVSA